MITTVFYLLCIQLISVFRWGGTVSGTAWYSELRKDVLSVFPCVISWVWKCPSWLLKKDSLWAMAFWIDDPIYKKFKCTKTTFLKSTSKWVNLQATPWVGHLQFIQSRCIPHCYNVCVYYVFIYLLRLAMWLWDLSSPVRDWAWALGSESTNS